MDRPVPSSDGGLEALDDPLLPARGIAVGLALSSRVLGGPVLPDPMDLTHVPWLLEYAAAYIATRILIRCLRKARASRRARPRPNHRRQ
jgi:hypothetical protein